MVGKRLRDPVKIEDLRPGAYGHVGDVWLICTPNGILCHLNAGHTIAEHDDGTITVGPSILATDPESGATWHGYLVRGVWNSA